MSNHPSISSKNVTATALTGRTVLLATDDAARYEQHCAAFRSEWAPEGQRELVLTQSLADGYWRLERIASYEMAIYARDRVTFATNYADEPETMRKALIELDIERLNERELRNLRLQESRLRRHIQRDSEELRFLQSERKRQQEEQWEMAALAYRKAKNEEREFHSAELGFVFSNDEIEKFIAVSKLRTQVRINRPTLVTPTPNKRKAA
jgi:hypothetical protein